MWLDYGFCLDLRDTDLRPSLCRQPDKLHSILLGLVYVFMGPAPPLFFLLLSRLCCHHSLF